MSTMPPALLGLDDQDRAARLALAVFDDNRRSYDAVLAESRTDIPELVYALVCNYVRALVEQHGPERARVRVEATIVGHVEHLAELDEQPEGEPW